MELKTAIAELKSLQKKMKAYGHASGMLYYDSVTGAPAGITDALGETLGTLDEESYKLFINPETGKLLEYLTEHADELDRQTRREIEVLKKEYDKSSRVPMDEYVAYTVLTNKAQAVWHEAKAKNDFQLFRPYLEQIVATMKKFADYYDPNKAPYDVWLGEFEEGFSMQYLDRFFAQVRSALVPLLKKVQESGVEIDDSFLHKDYPVEKQREFSDYLMQTLTIDRDHCGIAETEHPFTIDFSKYDVRITTHYHADMLESSMYSVIHEGGHALYELHTGDELFGSCLGSGASMGVHESQSRFYENVIGRSREYVEMIFPKLTELFPEQLAGVTPEMFYRAVNKAEPSLIRTEADELTYPLHIMIRYELEKMLFDGRAEVARLPELWNKMYKEYLGIDVPDDTRGMLQDSHWSGGLIGYFPSYAVGSAYNVQMLERMKRELDVFGLVAKGDLAPIVGWLTEKVYKYGCLLKPVEVVENACGAPFDPKYYIDYLTAKMTEIYKLK